MLGLKLNHVSKSSHWESVVDIPTKVRYIGLIPYMPGLAQAALYWYSHGTQDGIKRHNWIKTTSGRRFDVIMTLSSRRVSTGLWYDTRCNKTGLRVELQGDIEWKETDTYGGPSDAYMRQ